MITYQFMGEWNWKPWKNTGASNVEEAKNRGWWKLAVAVPGSRLFIRRLVLGAIEKAERAATP